MPLPTVKDLLEAGVHFGHRTEHWHPKMKPYIFGAKNNVHIIDVVQTNEALENITKYVSGLVARGGRVMFISTKPQLQPIAQKYAEACKMPFVTERWLGGTFTNFVEIKRLIDNYLDLKDKREKGELKKYTKLEQLQFDRRIDELDKKIGGISDLKKLPDAVFVLDVRFDKTAITEATKRGVNVIAICDTNVNPEPIDMVIPGNDDSIASVTLLARVISDAVNAGRAQAKASLEVAADDADDVAVTVASKETVEELDDKMKEELAKEIVESKTKK